MAEQLEGSGLNPQQAKGVARAIHDHQTEHVATKADLLEIKAELAGFRVELAEFRAELRFHRWTLALIVALVLAVLGKVW
ncbi:MAG: hypothetical protein OXF47_08875 [Nitrospira sp.]|nr:hypothetical protein [Nitrospira sp.]